jgi:hypothetical protein
MISLDDLPSVYADVEIGARVLQDGWVGVFYLPSPCTEHQAIAADCIYDYLTFANSKNLCLEIDEEGDVVELTSDEIDARLAALRIPSDASVGFHLLDNAVGVCGFHVRYIGLHPGEPMVEAFPNAVSLLMFAYPTQAVETAGIEAIVELHDSMASRLPLSSGYTSPAFLFANGAGEPAAFEAIRAMSRRYRCLDIPYISIDYFELGHKFKGAYWLNYLGAESIAALGGAEAIEKALQGAGVICRSLPGDVMALQVDAPPSGGDTNRQVDVSAYIAIAKLIEPLQYLPEIPFPGFEPEDTAEWFQRFAVAPT